MTVIRLDRTPEGAESGRLTTDEDDYRCRIRPGLEFRDPHDPAVSIVITYRSGATRTFTPVED